MVKGVDASVGRDVSTAPGVTVAVICNAKADKHIVKDSLKLTPQIPRDGAVVRMLHISRDRAGCCNCPAPCSAAAVCRCRRAGFEQAHCKAGLFGGMPGSVVDSGKARNMLCMIHCNRVSYYIIYIPAQKGACVTYPGRDSGVLRV
jgi:hypothetical protein